MASTGQGSGGGSRQRETDDAKTVADAGERGGSGQVGGGIAGGAAGGAAGSTGGGQSSGAGSDGQAGSQSPSGSEAGDGGEGQAGEMGSGEAEGTEKEDARVANLPEDIPVDGSADDQVARQIREAAIAEQDPMIRDALWDEYRKHMGIKK